MLGTGTRSAAIVAAEVAAPGRPVTGRQQRLYHEVVDRAIAMHEGRIFELSPDRTLVAFTTALDAVGCARQIQAGLTSDPGVPPEHRIDLRIGIHHDDVETEGGTLKGPGVDLALRLKTLAEPGEICVSRAVRERTRNHSDLAFQDLAAIKGRYVPHGGLAFRLVQREPAARRRRLPALPAPLRLGAAALLLAALAWLALSGAGAPVP